ncbi:MAG: hydroxymethylbilane synthase [Candidatus Methanofastidiosia archaeon]
MICGTRGSLLAKVQTDHVVKLLSAFTKEDIFTKVVQTSGDAYSGAFGTGDATKRMFTKEIDKALDLEEIDFAVHSLKDVSVNYCFHIAVPKRASPCDALVSPYSSLAKIPGGGKIGTGSLRRMTEIRRLRPDVSIVPIRGNVDTRLKKLSVLDGIILAEAGLRRLRKWGHGPFNYAAIDPVSFIPCAGQGALGVVCRLDDKKMIDLLEHIQDKRATIETSAERMFMKEVGGSCHLPIGVWANLDKTLTIRCAINDPDSMQSFRGSINGDAEQKDMLVKSLVSDMMSGGAREIVRKLQ